MSISIEPFDEVRRADVIRLVDRVFPSQSPVERLSMRVFQTRWDWLLRLGGIRNGQFWMALKDDTVLGTVGLYETAKDAGTAYWVGWFCVSPEARGQRLGQRLIDFAVGEAKAARRRHLRLYTSTDPNEAAAQQLYERNGFAIVGETRPWLWRLAGSPVRLLYREKALFP
jgi:GNAT superfamily N-acetyltransferase